MSKIRFFNVKIKDGNGSKNIIVPAHSSGNAEGYFNNPHIKATAKYIGFHEVRLSYNGSSIIFEADSLMYDDESVGYNYLYSHLRVSITEFIDDIKSKGLY